MLHLITIFSKIMVGLSKNFPNFSGSAEELVDFGTTLADFGYEFNADGELRNAATKEKFVFEVKKGDRAYNQRRYEALGEVINDEVYQLLEKQCKLKRIYIPLDASKDEPKGFFFASEDFKTNENLLILIHGSGVVRAGQWARRLIINDNLSSGTQIPYIQRAKKSDFAVLVLNTNQNKVEDRSGRQRFIRDSEDPLAHALHVWDNFVAPCDSKRIAIVAHSAGGYVTVNLALQRSEHFLKRVFAVAFTDSVHSPLKEDTLILKHLKKIAKNWVSARDTLDTPLPSYYNDIPIVSAGTTVHELTSHTAIDSVFKFLQEKFEDFSFVTSFLSNSPASKSADADTGADADDEADSMKPSVGDDLLEAADETDEDLLNFTNNSSTTNDNGSVPNSEENHDFEKVGDDSLPNPDEDSEDEKLSELLPKKRERPEILKDESSNEAENGGGGDQPSAKRGKREESEYEL